MTQSWINVLVDWIDKGFDPLEFLHDLFRTVHVARQEKTKEKKNIDTRAHKNKHVERQREIEEVCRQNEQHTQGPIFFDNVSSSVLFLFHPIT